MIVRIDNSVHTEIETFYAISMQLHPTLSEAVIQAKKERLYAAIRSLKDYPIFIQRLATNARG